MRTSTKILLVTFSLLAISLMIYDLGLKAEYLKGDYTDPYRDYVPLNYSGFDEIELNASTAVNIIVVQGPYKLIANPSAMNFLHVSKHNNRLIIDAAFNDHFIAFNSTYLLYISCPKLSLLKTDAHYAAGGALVTDTVARDLNWKPTMISGFRLDSLSLQADHASNVVLENNKINKLTAAIGLNKNSGSALTIGANNQFVQTDLNILNKSRLWIKDKGKNYYNFHLADSATLMVNGAAAKNLIKLK